MVSLIIFKNFCLWFNSSLEIIYDPKIISKVSEPPKKKMKLPRVKGLQHAIISVKSKVMSAEQAADKFKVDLQLLKNELGITDQPKVYIFSFIDLYFQVPEIISFMCCCLNMLLCY